RLFGVYGPGEADGRLFPHLVRALSEGVPVPLSDGRQVRDFIHVDDVCEGLLRLAEIDAPRVLVNLGTGSGVRIRDAAAWTADALGADRALLRFGAAPRSPGDENRLVADVTRLRALLSWVPPQRLRPGMDARELFGG
ncbi:MAG: NAD-dependent epimerase/dehydratase family protein, partial [Armatimonadetes bacterium]|nr:NAD-dependent epimerase/dehydratase family protein [Armatimonadota bacterium]